MDKQGRIVSIVRSPWVLIAIPTILGGMWLILHPEIITNNLDKPYALLAGPATILTGLAAWGLFAFFKTISSWCKSTWTEFIAWKKKDGSSFWLTIYIFLIISVLESGTYFSYLFNSNNLFGILGYASAFGIDLVTVVCMRARLSAVRMRDKNGATIHLIGLIFCAAISTFANGFTALYHWQAPQHTAIPDLMIKTAPAVGVIFPLLIIFLSLAGDHIADQSSAKLDPEQYRMSEQKRIDLIAIQRDMMRTRLQIEQEIDQMTQRRRSGKPGRTFFLVTWLFPRDPLSMQSVTTAVVEEIKKTYDAQFAGLNQQVSSQLHQLAQQTTQSSQSAIKEIQITLSNLQIDLTAERSSAGQQLSAITKQIELISESNGHFKDEIESTLSTTISEQIATALQSYNLLDETAITEYITAAIEQYTVDQTDDHSVPIDSPKPLYRLLTDDLKQVVERFPMIDSWIRTGQRTVSVSNIVEATGFSSQFVGRQASDGQFTKIKTDNLKAKTDSIYNAKSVINWLKTNPSPQKRTAKKREQITEEVNVIPQQDAEELSVNNGRMNDLLTSATTPKFWSQEQNTDAIPTTNGHTEVRSEEYAELTI